MARRVNTSFLTIVLLIVVGGSAALYLAQKLLIHEHPDRYIHAGVEAAKDERWDDAVTNFNKAASLSPSDTDLLMKLGSALHQLARNDPDQLWQEQAAYVRALDVDPNFLPAVKALVQWYQAAVTNNPDPNLYRDLIRYARRAHELAPNDPDLASLADQFIVQKWISGLETNKEEVDQAVNNLEQQLKAHPDNAQLPLTIAQALIQQGQAVARQSPASTQPAEATALYKQSTRDFQQLLGGTTVGPQDANASMHFRYAQVLEYLAGIDQSSTDSRARYLEQAQAQIDRARALAKPGDADYLAINQYAAEMAQRRGDREQAIRIYRSLPDRVDVRMALAQTLGSDPQTRAEGEQLLESTLTALSGDPNRLVGERLIVLGLLTDLQISDYAQTTDPQLKKHMGEQIQDVLDKMTVAAGSRLPLDLQRRTARFELLSGRASDVIRDLSRLIANDPSAAKDYVILSLLAEAYRQTDQSAQAMRLLESVVEKFPRETAARKDLVRLLLSESPERAAPQLDELDRQAPNDPDLIPMHIQLLAVGPDRDRNKAKIKEYFDRLGQSTDHELEIKSRIAIQLQDWEQAVGLLQLRVGRDPSDADDCAVLARVLMYLGRKDEALKAAQSGLAANPDNAALKILVPAIKGEDPKLVENLREDLARQNPDHVEGELELAILSRERGDDAGVESHLKAAEKLSPNSPRVWQELFKFYLDAKRPDAAQPYVDRLASVNYDGAGGDLDRFWLAMARGQLEDAMQIATRLTQSRPEYADTWIAMGNVLEARGQPEQAIAQYAIALEKQSGNRDAYLGIIRCNYSLDRPNDALQEINEALKRLPSDSTLRELYINHQLNYGNPQDAIAALQEEIRRSPSSPDLYAALGSTSVRAAKLYEADHDHAQAIATLRQAIDLLSKSRQRWPDQASLNIALADAQITAGEAVSALKTLQAWADRDAWRMRPDPHLQLAQFYERFGQPALAESELRTALARSDYRPDLQIAMANMLAAHGKFDQAVELLRATNADQPIVRQAVIEVLLKKGDFDQAVAQIKSELDSHSPDSVQLLTIWSRALMDRGDYAQASQRAAQALELDPKDQTALYCRGRCRLHFNPPDGQGALEDLTAVRMANPTNAQVRLDLAGAYILLGRAEDAITELKAGLRANPYNKPVRMMLIDLYTNNSHPRTAEAMHLLQEVDSHPPFDADPQIFNREALVLAQAQQWDDALAKSEKARSLAGQDPVVLATNLSLLLKLNRWQDVIDRCGKLPDKLGGTSWALLDRATAEAALEKGSAKSTDDLQKALVATVAENNPEMLHNVALAIASQLGVEHAIAAISPLASQNLAAKLALVELLHDKGDDALAVATAEQAADHYDSLAAAQKLAVARCLAMIYQSSKNVPPQKCYDALQRWLALQPDSVEALNNMACLLADDFQPSRAADGMPYIRKAMDLMTRTGRSDANLMDTQGWLLILTGSAAQGVDILNQVIENKPFPEAYLHLGEGYLRMNLASDAAAQAELGLDLFKKLPAKDQDPRLRVKLYDLSARSEKLAKLNQQGQVP